MFPLVPQFVADVPRFEAVWIELLFGLPRQKLQPFVADAAKLFREPRWFRWFIVGLFELSVIVANRIESNALQTGFFQYEAAMQQRFSAQTTRQRIEFDQIRSRSIGTRQR